MITELDNNNYEEETKNGLKLIEFSADWCGFCSRQNIILKELDKIWIGKVDTDKNRELAKKYNITALPSFVLLKNGNEVERFSGLHSKFDIMNIITKHLK
ncbi:thioredoxin family protein [bacterium]|nr:thioredoxin family protein [bacterium]